MVPGSCRSCKPGRALACGMSDALRGCCGPVDSFRGNSKTVSSSFLCGSWHCVSPTSWMRQAMPHSGSLLQPSANLTVRSAVTSHGLLCQRGGTRATTQMLRALAEKANAESWGMGSSQGAGAMVSHKTSRQVRLSESCAGKWCPGEPGTGLPQLRKAHGSTIKPIFSSTYVVCKAVALTRPALQSAQHRM